MLVFIAWPEFWDAWGYRIITGQLPTDIYYFKTKRLIMKTFCKMPQKDVSNQELSAFNLNY